MLLPLRPDVVLLLRHAVRLHPSAFCAPLRVRLCTGCQRHVSMLQSPKLLQKMRWAFSRSHREQTCTFYTSANSLLRRTDLLGSKSDNPGPSGGRSGDEGLSNSTPASPSAKNEAAFDKGVQATETVLKKSGVTGGQGKPVDAKSEKILKVTPKPRKAKVLEYSYTGNIYILPVRAMNEFLLKPSDLEGLPKYERRSPYESGPRITVYLRTDVETIAKQVWGSLENVTKEKNRLYKLDRKNSNRYDLFHIHNLLNEQKNMSGVGDERPYLGSDEPKVLAQKQQFMQSGSARVVMSAILVNSLNSVMKLIAWLYTGSHSMFSEFVHSVADTMNQIILGVGLYHSIKKPDPDHPYGYSNLRNISSLISGVGIFFFGTGLSFYHGFQGFMHPEPLTSLHWGMATLVGAFVSEGATLLIAINQVKKSSREMGIDFWQYVRQGVDPNVSVVLLEDMAAVVGVGVAGVCMLLTQHMASNVPDALGSCIIGGLLGVVASFVIYTNTSALVGKSIPFPVRQGISQELEEDRMIRSLHDVKATHMGGQIRFKAEVDFDGREITRAYLYKQDLDLLLAEMRELKTGEEVEAFMLKHGESIVDTLGEEVDRIEKVLKKKYPDLRHVDLEAL